MTRYFAYGSNMNPQRVRERGLAVVRAEAARLPGFRLAFDKCSAPGAAGVGRAASGHASLPEPVWKACCTGWLAPAR